MEFPVARNPQVKWKTGMLNEAEEMKDADFPEIRLFHVEHQLAPDGEKEDCVGKWVVCNPENLKDFSAVGFVFGRKLYKELSTPVGLIQSTWGGTHAESWTSMKVMENNPLYADVLKQYSKERVSREKDKCKVPATLWNGMIAPMVGYTVKGNIWYQGESNSVRYEKYQEVFTWTTDGFYRETKEKVAYRKAEGCSVVEMECSALAACAAFRDATWGMILYTADSLAEVDRYDERNWGGNAYEYALILCLDSVLAV